MTEPIGPPKIEPLPDAAWSRIERELWDRMDRDTPAPAAARRVRSTWWIAAPMVAVAAAIALWFGLVRPSAPPIPNTDDEPARVVAGATPSAASFGDAHVALDANSAFAMQHDGARLIGTLEYGAAWFSIAPRGDRPPFEVRAGDAIVRVVGTRFRVARDGERVEVAVDHGVVEVRFRGALVTLTANRSWSSTTPTEVAEASAPAPLSAAPVAPAPTPAPVAPTPAPVAPTPVLPARPTPPPSAIDTSRARYDALQRLEATRPDAAIAGYLELASTPGKWAEIALFAAGRLAVDRHDPRAQTLLTTYLDRFPRGANSVDAHELLNRLAGGSR